MGFQPSLLPSKEKEPVSGLDCGLAFSACPLAAACGSPVVAAPPEEVPEVDFLLEDADIEPEPEDDDPDEEPEEDDPEDPPELGCALWALITAAREGWLTRAFGDKQDDTVHCAPQV
jgi:hypothetical protein